MGKDCDFAFSFSSVFLELILVFEEAAFEFLILSANELKLVLEFSHLSSGETEVFLGSSDFLAERTVLRDEFLDSLFVGLRFLVVGADFVAIFVEFSVEFVHLVG